MKVAIIGATGYSGAELIRLLHQHPEVEIHSFHTSSQVGMMMKESYPHLQTITNEALEEINPKKIAEEVDLVFTSTPSGVASTLVPKLLKHDVKVIDISGDFRLKDREKYEEWYQLEAGGEEVLDQAVYGLTEWVKEDLSIKKFVSNPGCFPTAVLLGLAPLLKENMVRENSIIIDAKTGVSGAGKSASANTHFPETNDNIKIYRVNEHQHIPEIEQGLALFDSEIGAVTFSTHMVPMTRGIMATMYMDVKQDVDIDHLFDLFKQTYQNNHFIRIREKGVFPNTKQVSGSNFCDISLAYDKRTKRITVVSVVDNLVKGASGQAVQNMNRMLGFDETLGLDFVPVYP